MLKIHKSSLTLKNCLPYILMIAGVIGVIASFTLTYDKIQLLQNSDYSPPCNINPVFSCGSVMKAEQASLLGVPNSVFGLIAFSMLFTFGFLLAGGAKVKRTVWLGAQLAATAGVVFMHYLFFQGVVRINTICPWCFLVWIITIPVFWYITQFNLQQQNIKLPAALAPVSAFVQKHHLDILIIWYLIIIGILLQHFWYYWSTLIF